VKKKRGEHGALRAEAERRLLARGTRSEVAPEDAPGLVHELEVHRVELEIQNEELLRSRAELELALARYTALYDAAPVGFVTLSANGTIREANIAAAAIVGRVPAELIDRRLATFVADEAKNDLASLFARLDAGEERVLGDIVVVASHGPRSRRHVDVTITRVAGAEERHAALVDVTERRLLEEQLRTSQRMEAIGRLAGGIAHDFNNLLTVILGHADLALARFPAGDTHDDFLELKGAAVRASTLTRQLLAFARRQTLKPQVVDVNQLVGSLTTIIQRLIGERITVRTTFAEDVARVEIDPSQLEQIMMNLAVNARDAMPNGGTFTVTTANARDGARSVLLSVGDNGTGMDASTLSRIFEPFFTTKAHGEGTGFGLATVYGIVKQCGGEITVRSEIDKGSIFEIRLPATDAETTQPVAKKTAPAVETTSTETILLVEDEPSVRRLVERALTNLGYAVITAGSAEEAVEVCAGHTGVIDLALCDVTLPKASGPEFALHLKKERPKTKVVFMSGYPRDALGADGIVGRDTNFIAKPFRSDELAKLIRSVLDGAAGNTDERGE
jgi:two-component system cell cycle sensor histidine kinase/response regulator CckA